MAAARYYGTGRRKSSVARVYLVIFRFGNIETDCAPAAGTDINNRKIRCSVKCTRRWFHWSGRRNQTWHFQSFAAGRR